MQEDKVLSDQDNHMLYFALGDNWGCIWCRRVSGDISGQNYCGVTFKVAKVCVFLFITIVIVLYRRLITPVASLNNG